MKTISELEEVIQNARTKGYSEEVIQQSPRIPEEIGIAYTVGSYVFAYSKKSGRTFFEIVPEGGNSGNDVGYLEDLESIGITITRYETMWKFGQTGTTYSGTELDYYPRNVRTNREFMSATYSSQDRLVGAITLVQPKIDFNSPLVQKATQYVKRDYSSYGLLRGIHYFISDNIQYQISNGVQSASETLQLGSGDCLDMSILFIALARSLGINSCSVESSNCCYVVGIPKLQHAIVGCSSNGNVVYFDPTAGILGDTVAPTAVIEILKNLDTSISEDAICFDDQSYEYPC
jgi:hypothetical protein